MTTKKLDRRTIYTLNIIKNTFLELEKTLSFDKINVKMLCEKAEISRATFYIHYESLDSVLDDVLDEALLFSEIHNGTVLDFISIINSDKTDEYKNYDAVLPACQRIADSDKYHALFMDPTLSGYIIMRIAQHEKEKVVPELKSYRC